MRCAGEGRIEVVIGERKCVRIVEGEIHVHCMLMWVACSRHACVGSLFMACSC